MKTSQSERLPFFGAYAERHSIGCRNYHTTWQWNQRIRNAGISYGTWPPLVEARLTLTLHKLIQSAEDIDALLSCACFILCLYPGAACVSSSRMLTALSTHALAMNDRYVRLYLERGSRLSHTLELILRDAIVADASDYGIDLAVSKIFPTYQPCVHRWKNLEYPDTCWLTCQTNATMD